MRISKATIEKILSKNRYFSKVFYFSKLKSTNDLAKQDDIPDNSLIITNYQTNGRGRLNNKWNSEQGKNLTFTLKQKLNYSYSEQHIINFYYTHSIAQALENFLLNKIKRLSLCKIEIKWPNDILLNGKKIGGILIEYSKQYYIIGVGLNINQTNFNFLNFYKPTSLRKEYKTKFSKLDVLDSIIEQLSNSTKLLDKKKFKNIYSLWNKKLAMSNKIVNINGVTGIIKKVNQNGSIVITTDNIEKTYFSGEITI